VALLHAEYSTILEGRNSNKSIIDWSESDLAFRNKKRNQDQTAYDYARLSESLDYTNKNGLKAIQLDKVKVKATATKKPFKDGAFYDAGKQVASGLLTVVTSGVRSGEVAGEQYDVIDFDAW
jgi:hypothetical protein